MLICCLTWDKDLKSPTVDSNIEVKVVNKKDTFLLLKYKMQLWQLVGYIGSRPVWPVKERRTMSVVWEVVFERQLEVESGGVSFLLCQTQGKYACQYAHKATSYRLLYACKELCII